MATDVVNTVVARCLLEPGYLERFERDPRAEVARLDVDESTRRELSSLDCQRLRRFGGFISKVQHNELWEHFPYTRALLKLYGAELDTFAAYRDEHLDLVRAGKPTREQKARSFLSFLEARLQGDAGADCPGLLDVITHERLQWEVAGELVELGAAGAGHAASELPASEPSDRWIAVPRDVLRVAAVHHHPLEVIAALRENPDELRNLPARTACLCYWGRVAGESIRILELDPITATVVAGVDGRRSARDILGMARDALPDDITPADLRFVLDAVVRRGLVGLVEPAAAGR